MEDNQPKIKVIVRKRPLNRKEVARGERDIVAVRDSYTVAVRQEKYLGQQRRQKVDLTKYTDEYVYTFDGAYGQHVNNVQLYEHAVKPLIDSAFAGAKVTCFAYGQTGSGKTYTMLGAPQQHIPGMYLLASHDIFKKLMRSQYERFTCWVSFYEIYCGKLYDLLNDRTVLFAREDAKQNVNIVGLQEKKIGSVEQLMQTIEYGGSVRITAQNSANADSSRSHAVLQIMLKDGTKCYSKISFIDLAGSERGADHADESKQTRIDGAEINKSLLALKECIRALDHHKNHTPFRGSKLTMVLKDSFTGYCRSLMISNISPGSSSCENTLNTLKYADRVKELKKPRDSEPEDDLLQEMMLPRHNIQNNNKAAQLRLVMQQDPEDINENHNDDNIRRPIEEKPKRSLPPPAQPSPSQYSELFPRSQSQQYSNHQSHHSPTKPSLEQNEINRLTSRHEELISNKCSDSEKIISSEEELIEHHQAHITQTVNIVKHEGQLMAEMDRVNSDIRHYLDSLTQLLGRKAASLTSLQKRISGLQRDIKESQQIERLVKSSQPPNGSDDLLLDDLLEQHVSLF